MTDEERALIIANQNKNTQAILAELERLAYKLRWHYPSKGDYPPSEKLVLCLLWEAEFAIGCFDIRDKSWIFKDIKGEEIDLSNEYADNITAWMPLPLPPKENEK